MRLAGSPEIFDALSRHFGSDGVPAPAAKHLAAEVMTHGDEANTRIDRFMELYSMLESKGFSADAAQHLAIEMMEGREQEPAAGMRFARVYGDE